MRVLVTGATGFVGGHLCQEFLHSGHQVVAMVRRESQWLAKLGVKQVIAHLEDPDSLQSALTEAGKVETLVHNAGLVRAKSLDHYWEVNAIGTFNLLEAVKSAGTLSGQVIYISSLAAAGPGRLVREEDKPRPITPYGTSKLYGERFLKASGIPGLILRPPVIYGPRDRALLGFFKLVKLGWVPNWQRHYSLCFVRDLARACVASAEAGLANETIFVAQGEFSFHHLCQVAGKILNKEPKAITLPQFLIGAAGAVGGLCRCLFNVAPLLSPEKAREMREPAWSCSTEQYENMGLPPHSPLEEGFEETIAWYKEQGWL